MTQLEFNLAVKTLQEQITESGFKPDVICGISRGGLIPGVMLSHKFGVPFIPLTWSTRDFISKDLIVINNMCSLNKNILIVDDISDTGVTLHEINDAIKLNETKSVFKYATIHCREDSSFKPEYFVVGIDTKDWITYPYEDF